MAVNCSINTFVVQSKSKLLHHALLLLSPSARSGFPADRLFVIAEISTSRKSSADGAEQTRLFSSQLFKQYKECKNEENSSGECFEKLLEWANRHVMQFLEIDKNTAPATIAIGCLSGEKIFLSISGTPSAFIYFKDGDNFRSLDLIKTYGGSQEETKQTPFFYSLISGELHIDNYVIISTAPVSDFVPPDNVQNIITENEGAEAVEMLSKQLSAVAPHLAISGLLISHPNTQKKPHFPANSFTLSTSSIKRLIHQGQTTEKILDSSFFTKIKTIFLPHLMPHSAKNAAKRGHAKQPQNFSIQKTAPLNFITFLQRTNTYIQSLLLRFGLFLVNSIRKIKLLVKSPQQEHRALLNGLQHSTSTSISKWKTRWIILPKKQRIIIIICTVGGLLVILNIAGFVARSHSLQNQAVYNSNYNNIKEKLDAIESMIIYNDLSQARIEARDLQTQIAEFPTDSSKHKGTQLQLQKSLDELMFKLRQLTTVSPVLVADFTPLNPGNVSRVITGGEWVSVFGSDARVLTINTRTKEIKQIDAPLLGLINGKTEKDGNNYIVAVDNKRLVNIQMPSVAITSLDTVWPTPPAIKALGWYNNKLYAVDGARGMIIKYETSSKGFSKGTDWLRAQHNELSEASALAIDSSIYVGTNTGVLYKFSNGNGERVSLDLLDPQLKTITALYTTKGSSLLFILDATEKRIIVWDKKGSLKDQYTSDQFENLKDFSVDERTKEITVLAGTKVFKFGY